MQHKFVRFASVFVVFVKRLQCGTGILNTPIYKMQANLKTWGMKISFRVSAAVVTSSMDRLGEGNLYVKTLVKLYLTVKTFTGISLFNWTE